MIKRGRMTRKERVLARTKRKLRKQRQVYSLIKKRMRHQSTRDK